MNEILDFIINNLPTFIDKKNGRLDFTVEDGTKIKIYKCGATVTRIDIVKEEK